jgi:hypothetical protein
MSSIKKFVVALSILLLPLFIFAHGVGQTLSLDAGNYEIDIDLDNENPKLGDSVRFDFDLLSKNENLQAPEFDYVWVRIQNDQKIIFAGGIGKPDFGSLGLTTVLPDSGEYSISVRFQRGEEKISEGSATFEVSKGDGIEQSFVEYFFTEQFFVGLLIGLVVVIFLKKFVPNGKFL